MNASDDRFMAPSKMFARNTPALAEQGDAASAAHALMAGRILESLALGLAEAQRDAGRQADREVVVIHLVGGAALKSLRCQLTADRVRMLILGGPVKPTTLGNVLVQARALGLDGTVQQLRALLSRVYPPQRFEVRA